MKKKIFTFFLTLVASVGTMFANQVWPIIMDETTFAICNSNSTVVADFRPNNQDCFLYIWGDIGTHTYDSLVAAGPNFMENTDGYLSLRVTNLGWAGAGFCLTDNGNSWQAAEQLRAAIVANPDNYYLHMAIKSEDNYSHCFYLFDTEATKFVLGNHSVYNVPVYSDFTRDGEWQEFYIPTSTFASALADVTCNAGVNIFEMLSEGVQGAMLDLDAVYICDREFIKNNSQYSITTESSNPEWGATAGDTTVTYMSEVEISATPNYGYHFVSWNDGNTSNPRIVSVTKDRTYTAIFAKNVYSITKNAENGSISGSSSAEYLDTVLLSVVPYKGYQFIKWSDGNTDNPRTIELTQDTTMEAIFDYLLTGKCGKDSALTWTFEPASMALNITGKGALSENYTYGTFIESLTIGNEVTTIGEDAFYKCNNLKNVIIGSAVKVLEERAFYNCSSIETITCYSMRPPTVNTDALYGLDYGTIVYVPADYLETYKMHDAWGLYDVRPLGAKSTETTDVNVTPAENTAEVAWPAVSGAATYELVIKDKSGNVICTLVFNANGQLTQIAFGAPARNNAPQQTPAAGFSFTVTGLESGTSYDLTITSKDNNGTTLDTKTISFTTSGDVPQGIDQVLSDQVQCTKVIKNGQIFILRGDKTYTLTGQETIMP